MVGQRLDDSDFSYIFVKANGCELACRPCPFPSFRIECF